MEAGKKWGVVLDMGGHSEVSREADPDDEWDRDDVCHSQWINGARVAAPGESASLAAAFEPVAGEVVYVVAVTYSTGDSFHRESGLMEAVAAFKTERLARWLAAAVEVEGTGSVGYFDEDGSLSTIYASWVGYFESLDSVSVESFVLMPAPAPAAPRRR